MLQGINQCHIICLSKLSALFQMLLSIVFSVNNLDSNQDIIHLNVEGTHYTTTRGTLTCCPGSRLHAMFKNNPTEICLKDGRGNYFINRDGKIFRLVLHLLRDSMIQLGENDSYKAFSTELDYYKIKFKPSWGEPRLYELV